MNVPPVRAGAEVTVVLLTREPCPDLEACLASVAWAGEIIAVDDGSGDGTLELLGRHGARVMPQDRELVRAHRGNFDVARNPAFDRARGDWVLVVDSDEIVTSNLREEIEGVVDRGDRAAYAIPRRNLYWGRPSRALGDDYQLRLFPRGAARYAGTRLDRPPEVDFPVSRLREPLVHRQRRLLRKLRDRTEQRARRAAEAGEIPEAGSLSLFWHHLRWYALRQGTWREGPRGLAVAALYAAYPALEAFKARRIRRAESRR